MLRQSLCRGTMRCILLVLSYYAMVAAATLSVEVTPATPQVVRVTPQTASSTTTSSRMTTHEMTVPQTTQSTTVSTSPTTAEDARPLSECAVPTFSMRLRSARNSSGVWTDEVESADAVEDGGERRPGGYWVDVEHAASYSCGGGESASLTVTLTAPVLPLPPIGKL